MKEKVLDKDTIALSQLRQMEIIDISEGKRLGFITDIIFNEDFTKIDSLVVPVSSSVFSLFRKREELLIKWDQIKTLGIDIILVDTSYKGEKNL